MNRSVRNGALVFATIHVVLGILIVLCARRDVDSLMTFLLIDYPLVAASDASPAVRALFDAMSPRGSGGVIPFLLFGTAMYSVFGAGAGWLIGRLQCRMRCLDGACRQCGYDLTGNVSGVCPECGTGISGSVPPPRTEGRHTRGDGAAKP